jgi:hypothetical protein
MPAPRNILGAKRGGLGQNGPVDGNRSAGGADLSPINLKNPTGRRVFLWKRQPQEKSQAASLGAFFMPIEHIFTTLR